MEQWGPQQYHLPRAAAIRVSVQQFDRVDRPEYTALGEDHTLRLAGCSRSVHQHGPVVRCCRLQGCGWKLPARCHRILKGAHPTRKLGSRAPHADCRQSDVGQEWRALQDEQVRDKKFGLGVLHAIAKLFIDPPRVDGQNHGAQEASACDKGDDPIWMIAPSHREACAALESIGRCHVPRKRSGGCHHIAKGQPLLLIHQEVLVDEAGEGISIQRW
mmetsp:Transcript_101031/g.261633  ORF Transcript_101031/g.261633 Transcript_101031/m.261633 type:complete len:216 (-) Transcript_101031:265-912(-)